MLTIRSLVVLHNHANDQKKINLAQTNNLVVSKMLSEVGLKPHTDLMSAIEGGNFPKA